MAEPISRIPGHPRYDPTEVAGAAFDTVRRGFDEVQVRSFLSDLASALRASYAVEDRLRKELARLEARVDDAETIDDAALVERLGEEAAKILNAAREAAATRLQQADEDASATAERAARHATDVRARADRALEEKLAEAEAAAAAILAESEGIVEAARAEAVAIVDEARSQGRQMIDETIQHREQMLQNMERRRQRAKIQVERLQAGRDRLLASYEVVQRTLDEARAELEVSLPEAKIEAARAARRLEEQEPRTSAELEAELATARLAGLVDADAPPDPVAEEPEPVAAEPVAEEPEPVAEEPEPVAGDAQPEEAEPEPAEEPVAEEPVAEEPVAEEPVAEEPVVEEPVAEEPEPVAEEPEPVAEDAQQEEGEPEQPQPEEPVAEEARPGELDEPEAPASARVDDLFAQLRSEPDAGRPVTAATGSPGDEVLTDAEIGELLTRRETALQPVAATLARDLKRALTGSQNDLLDLLRRGSVEDLPDVDAPLVAAADAALTAAWTVGAAFFGRTPPEPAESGDLREAFVGAYVAPLKSALAGCLSGGGAVAEAIRAVFREYRGEPLAREVDRLTTAAFTRGVYDATPKRHPMVWVPDETTAPCPAAAGNVAAGAVRRGEHYPSGTAYPPAGPGCRCLLKPVDQ